MKRIKLILVALITIIGSFSYAFGGETADDLDQGLTVPACGHINESEMHLLNSAVGPNVTSASFILSWDETADDLEMVLVAPSGTRIDPDVEEPIIYQEDAGLIYYIIPYPEPGDWTAEITARTVREMGEDYCAFTVLDEDEAIVGGETNETNETDKTMSENPSDFEGEVQEIEECAECNSH